MRDDAADRLDEAQRRYLQSAKGKAALRRYAQGKGKEAQAKYYREKVKPARELAKLFKQWQATNPTGTFEDFIGGLNGPKGTNAETGK